MPDPGRSRAGHDTIESAEAVGVATALARLAERLGEHPVIRRLAAQEPGVLAALVLPEQAGDATVIWQSARACLAALLDGRADVEQVLRFLVSQLLWPAGREEIATAVAVLLCTGSPIEADLPGPDQLPVHVSDLVAPELASPVVPGLGWPAGERAAQRVGVV